MIFFTCASKNEVLQFQIEYLRYECGVPGFCPTWFRQMWLNRFSQMLILRVASFIGVASVLSFIHSKDDGEGGAIDFPSPF